MKTRSRNLVIIALLLATISISGCTPSDIREPNSSGAYMNDADIRRLDHFDTLPNKWNVSSGPIVTALVDPEVEIEGVLLAFDEHMTDLQLILVDMTNTINQIQHVEFRRLVQPLIINYGAKWEALNALQKGYELGDTPAIETAQRELYEAAQATKGLACNYLDGLKRFASEDDLKLIDDKSSQLCE